MILSDIKDKSPDNTFQLIQKRGRVKTPNITLYQCKQAVRPLRPNACLHFFRCMHINQNIRALHTQNDSYSQLFSVYFLLLLQARTTAYKINNYQQKRLQ